MLSMMLRCLRYSITDADYRREGALWWERKVHAAKRRLPIRQKIKIGLGFSRTLEEFGFCWLTPIVDWKMLRFKSRYTDYVYFGNKSLGDSYMRRGRRMRDLQDASIQIDMIHDYLRRDINDLARSRLSEQLAYTVLRQFRIDVMQSCARNEFVNDEARTRALKGNLPFHPRLLLETLNNLHAITGNRTNVRDPELVLEWLFNVDDNLRRQRWDNRPYRALHRRSLVVLGDMPDAAIATELYQRHLTTMAKDHHPMLPWVGKDRFISRTKAGLRMWISTDIIRQLNPETGEEDEEYVWLGKELCTREPSTYPRYLSWTKGQTLKWLGRSGGMRLRGDERRLANVRENRSESGTDQD